MKSFEKQLIEAFERINNAYNYSYRCYFSQEFVNNNSNLFYRDLTGILRIKDFGYEVITTSLLPEGEYIVKYEKD